MPRPRRLPPPVLVLAVGIGASAVALALTTALQISVVASLDETVYKLSAAQYAAGGLQQVLADDVARGAARLYSLIIAPIFAVLPGDAAVRASRALNTLLWSLTAVPVYLLARRVTTSPWTAVAAALLTIAVPWATLSTVLFSESLAYLLFALTLLAMTATLRAPAPWKDALVVALLVALVLTRMQFVGLPVAWVLVVLGLELGPARARSGDWRCALRSIWRRFPVLGSVVALMAVGLLAAVVAGMAGAIVRGATGPYLLPRQRLPADVGLAVLFEVAMLALGTGILPLALAVAWWRRAVRGDAGPEAFRVAVVGLALIAAVYAVAVAAQGGWPGPDVAEERYGIYAVPVLLVAALAALELPGLRRSTLLWGGGAVAILLALAPTTAGLSGERAFLVPVAASVTNLGGRLNAWLAGQLGLADGTGQRDLLVVLAVAVVVFAAAAWRRSRWIALLPAVAVQLAFGGYALATMHGKVPGVPGVTPRVSTASLSWVDRARLGGDVAILEDRLDPERIGLLDVAFWNDAVGRSLRAPGLAPVRPPYPVSALPNAEASIDAALRLAPVPSARLVLVSARSPLLQLEGRTVARSPSGDARVIEVGRPARVRWAARGLAPDGAIAGPVQLAAAPAQVLLTLEAAPGGPRGTVRVALGERRRTATAAPGTQVTVRLRACSGAEPVTGAVEPVAGSGAVRLRAVDARPC